MTVPAWKQALVQWVRLCLAPYDTPAPVSPATTPVAYTIPVILTDQRDAPRPVNPNGGVEYASIRVLSDRSLGGLMRSATWDEGDEELTTTTYDRREGTVSISVFGPRANTLADAIALSLDDEDLIAPLEAASVAIGEEVGRQSIGVASGNVPDPREVIDYRFRRTASDARVTTGVIDNVALTFLPATNAEPDGDEDGAEDIIPPIIVE